jgi:ArsR family transcriptional regulator
MRTDWPAIARPTNLIFPDDARLFDARSLFMMRLLDSQDESAERAAAFLRSVAHAGRLRVICALMEGELSASELARQVGLRGPALSQQAAILEGKGLIGRRRAGRSVLYRLSAPEAKALANLLYRLFCKAASAPSRRRITKKDKT